MDAYEDLGVRPFINAADNYTRFGGSIMWPCAVEAMVEASRKVCQSVRTADEPIKFNKYADKVEINKFATPFPFIIEKDVF